MFLLSSVRVYSDDDDNGGNEGAVSMIITTMTMKMTATPTTMMTPTMTMMTMMMVKDLCGVLPPSPVLSNPRWASLQSSVIAIPIWLLLATIGTNGTFGTGISTDIGTGAKFLPVLPMIVPIGLSSAFCHLVTTNGTICELCKRTLSRVDFCLV